MLDAQTLDLFKVIVLDEFAVPPEGLSAKPYLEDLQQGFVTNFIPTPLQRAALCKAFKPLPLVTLFSVAERRAPDITPMSLIMTQLLHYIEVYGLDQPGLFNLEVKQGSVVVVANVRGVTVEELGDMVRALIYANAPVRKIEDVIELIKFHNIPYDLALVKNNEARIRLYRDGDQFASGDDAVRYIVFKTTGDSLLIKSPEVVAAVKSGERQVSLHFLMAHETVLAQVFNRHKRIIMALKNRRTAQAINRISRFSKTKHVPLRPALNKTFIARALGDLPFDYEDALEVISLRDKFKYLNLLEWRRLQNTDDVFIIRNGRAHLEPDRKVYPTKDITALIMSVADSIEADLRHLQGKSILLDPNVDYGLPTSQKQMLGSLPFGTTISVGNGNISSGIYWENRWGATDLDLAAIDEWGERTGWGELSGFDNNNPILFSGDITSAPEGAMEFMTSATTDCERVYGLLVNIFNGGNEAECELLVGSQFEGKNGQTRSGRSAKWIKSPVIREKVKLTSRETILGFVRNGKFVVFAPRLSNRRVSGGEITRRLIAKGMAPVWTISKLLAVAGIKYDTTPVDGVVYDYDLSYASFCVDKMERMLFNPQQVTPQKTFLTETAA